MQVLGLYFCVLEDGKSGTETCKSLIIVINCILLSVFVCLCINYKNMNGMSILTFSNAQQKLSTTAKHIGKSS